MNTRRILLIVLAAVAMGDSTNADDPFSHWAFRKFTTTAPPSVRRTGRVNTPIDAFVLARLESRGLTFASAAERATLIRRLYLDLLGLPPTIEQVDAYLVDRRPGAWERLVDRVLASPRFGERWGRHWLDVVGYADTVGFDMNPDGIVLAAGKWKYRDYVVSAFNEGKPYDVFIRQQLAGDESVPWRKAKKFTPRIVENLVATGFWRTAQDFTHEPISDIPSNHYAVIHDTLEILGASLFAVTLKCARCHDHKFDPIPQRDYYRLMACLTPAYNSKNWKAVYSYRKGVIDRALPDVSPSLKQEIDRHNRLLDAEVARLKKDKPKGHEKRVAELQKRRRSYGKIQALWDVGPPPATHLHLRGNFERPGKKVEPGFLSALSTGASAGTSAGASAGAAKSEKGSSGRRTQLANWATRPNTPASALLSRVMVNRIWMHLMGRGLVTSPGNFGLQGAHPTHPKLLEWLSAHYERDGWRTKSLVRLIVTSQVYKQASFRPASQHARAAKADAGNKLLWKMRLRRVDAEVVRDSLLVLGGTLDSRMGGAAIRTRTLSDGKVVEEKAGTQRRSIYLLVRRAYNPSLLSVFDQPIIGTTCAQRQPSAVVSQSLTMMNDAFLVLQSQRFAARVRKRSSDPATRIELAYRMSLARRPNEKEISWCLDFLQRQTKLHGSAERALTDLCHTLLNTSEFLYAE